MKTEDLIAALVADRESAPNLTRAAMLALAATLGVSAALLTMIWGLRPDMGAALEPLVALKTLLPLGLGGVALALALRLSHPTVAVGGLPSALLAAPALALIAAGLTLTTTDPAAWQMQAVGKSIAKCLASIPLLAALPMAGLMVALRQGACLTPRTTGFAVGLAAGGFAAMLYSLHCTEDSPLFYSLWYSLAVLVVAGIGAALGPRLLRW
jgi:hypothetical protein